MNKATKRRGLITVCMTALLMTGCGNAVENPYNHTDDEVAAAEAQLNQWPSLEETEPQIVAAVEQIRDAVTAIVPTLQWRWNRERSQGTCAGPFAKTNGVSVDLPNMFAEDPIPDTNWEAARAAAEKVAATVGATTASTGHDEPGNHLVTFTGDNGNKITIGSGKSTIISGNTGCRLRASDIQQQG